ncbi:HAD-like domain-containing protein [Aspergillus leporis]|uniref:HAD-like domain-containing protein n=1 Tax=Aspergillus leporis TaxID=41062 RepID=A0A5N5WJ84_9EURO|nr:HAD-like domain-containing protein [Aspergillus leporis]
MCKVDFPLIIFFDVLGTIVEWRCCIANELNATARMALQDQVRYLSADVRAHAYNTSKPFVSGLFNEDDLKYLTLAWHRLDLYCDSVPGLSLLSTKFLTSTLSNGNVKLLEDLQEHNSLPFKHITSAEHFGAYKPSPEVYHGAARRFGFRNLQCCLVAAHLEDLHAAKKCGFQTIYLERDLEEAWESRDIARAREEGFVDLWVEVGGSGLIEVARYFGIERGS